MDTHYLSINQRYVVGPRLGSGSFGEIYCGFDREESDQSPNKLVAIKLEKNNANVQILKFESEICRYLYQPNKGIPKIYWSGVQDDYNILVMEMLGSNLDNLFNLCSKQFSLKTIIIIAQELIKKIQYIHSRGIIHRDLKPENIMIGLHTNDIYVIDYGLCKFFKNKDNTHINMSQRGKLVGSVRYTSLNSHCGYELSRRDDLESIGYMLILFQKGKLPWQGLNQKGMPRDELYRLIYECKKNTTTEQLCQGLPKEFKLYMEHVRSLGFDEKPNYNYLYNLFTQLFKKNQYVYDDIFDWTAIKDQKIRQHLR